MRDKFKKGAASFYIVAFSTLILVIIAASFAAIIISEMTRTSNDDLAQSAYDSALAGVEDAKVAFFNYRKCIEGGGADGDFCDDIIGQIKSPNCDMVGRILGRVDESGGEVLIQEESSQGNNMQQAYTCVKIETELDDYKSSLDSNNATKVLKVQFKDGVKADTVNRVRVSWFSDADATSYRYNNFDASNSRVVFPGKVAPGTSSLTYAVPPTISFGFVQTGGDTFNYNDFTVVEDGSKTDRGMVYLVPTGSKTAAANHGGSNYIGVCNGACDDMGGNNVIGAGELVKSNDKVNKNLPYVVYCPEGAGNEFACSATINLPKPIGGERNKDTFMVVISLPYGKPNTDFKLEFLCDDGSNCGENIVAKDDGTQTISDHAMLDGMQIKVDSTGRANDLYRRVETRLEGVDDFTLSLMGPLELLTEKETDEGLSKVYSVTCEWNFPRRGC